MKDTAYKCGQRIFGDSFSRSQHKKQHGCDKAQLSWFIWRWFYCDVDTQCGDNADQFPPEVNTGRVRGAKRFGRQSFERLEKYMSVF